MFHLTALSLGNKELSHSRISSPNAKTLISLFKEFRKIHYMHIQASPCSELRTGNVLHF